MNPKKIMEIVFIFILPLLFILPCVSINKEYVYDNNGNFETSELTIHYDQSLYQSTYTTTNTSTSYVLHTDYSYITQGNIYFKSSDLEFSNDYYYLSYSFGKYSLWCRTLSINNNTITMDIYNEDIPYNVSKSCQLNNDGYYEMFITTSDINSYFSEDFEFIANWYTYEETTTTETKDTPFKIIHDLIVDNLHLNDTIVIDIIIDYTILWFVMFILWHLLYLFFDMLIHLFIDWGHSERKKL